MDAVSEFMAALERGREIGHEVTEKIFSAAHPRAVFGEPTRSGDYTLITASEVLAGGGFGFGGGTGVRPDARRPASSPEGERAMNDSPQLGGGGGAGGGGTSIARPVAVIVLGPDGIKVQPIVDVTKIVLAFVTAWGAMAVMLVRMSRARRS